MLFEPREYIRKLLLQGMSERQIAERINVDQSTIHRIKVGDTIYPRMDTLKKLYDLHGKMISKG